MIRIVVYLLAVAALAAGLHWLADRPGTIVIQWQGYVAETSVFIAIVMLAVLAAVMLLVWSGVRKIWASPAAIGRLVNRRRQRRGLEAISGGIIAIGAGDGGLANRYAQQARKSLPNEPLTHLLRAQAAQLSGDRATARRIFEAMLASPDTEQLGLRGLFLEARRESEEEPARQFAERALKLNPKLAWPVEALFDLMCKARDWQGALDTLEIARRQNLVDKAHASRRRAVLLTAKAQELEEGDAEKSLELALEAHRLAPDLVPSASIAGRVLASQGNTPRAARVLLKTWRLSPHPDLAAVYAYARPGDSPHDRLSRVRHLGRLTPQDSEAAIAISLAAIEAREWDEARQVLKPLLGPRLTQRVCTLMARIEGEQHANAGGVREWLARAVNAPRDPAWTADGVVAEHWAPTSPVTGALDAFDWRVPVEAIDAPAGARLAAKVEALVGLGAASETRLPPTVSPPVVATPIADAHDGLTEKNRPETRLSPAPSAPVPPDSPTPPSARAANQSERAVLEVAAEDRPARAARTSAEPAQPASSVPKPARPRQSRIRVEPKVFVPPRAPDDPGTDPAEEDPLPYLRGSPAKA